ncbi:uncharacterized protein E0L32_005965 [Thyridium curvatum]|uniref:Uncharacterized protein n=1 Tax=Thyridium curvatum TaxID=1093900 RepID=A0A507B449_9PEZI|nr:uncharacterized protein E0L32_005965 [Thyridium curvatum]TPX13494.1 hypothetical protein E0L32_005965 [Thyridium curvatum]
MGPLTNAGSSFVSERMQDSTSPMGLQSHPPSQRLGYAGMANTMATMLTYEPIQTDSGSGLTYNISSNDVTVISKTLKDLFTVTNYSEDATLDDEDAGGFDISGAMYDEDLGKLVGLVAQSMTCYIRDMNSTKILVPGTAFHREAYVSVRWPWLSLPAALVAFGAMMLVWTIWFNKVRSGPVWKSSSLPGILHARAGDQASSDVRDLEKLSGISDEAERTQMRLVRNEVGTLRLNDMVRAEQGEGGPCIPAVAAYAASKIVALRHAGTRVSHEQPALNVMHLHPDFVLGSNDVAATARSVKCLGGTNSVMLTILLGKTMGPFAGASAHVDDVARAHVASLDAWAGPWWE